MTLVGDVAQTGDLAGTSSWQRVLEPYVGDRWRLAGLIWSVLLFGVLSVLTFSDQLGKLFGS